MLKFPHGRWNQILPDEEKDKGHDYWPLEILHLGRVESILLVSACPGSMKNRSLRDKD
jgi:hypothetical protein